MQFGIKINGILIFMKQTGTKPLPRTRSKALIIFSRIASFIFHPLFMTAIMAIALYQLLPGDSINFNSQEFKKWIGTLLLYTVLLPLMSIFLFKISGLISNARMHEARDRILPLLATLVFYSLTYILFVYQHKIPVLLQALLLGSCSAIIIIFIINIFYKLSVHTAAAGILPGMCIVLLLSNKLTSVLPLLLALAIAAIVGIIRWLLGAHTMGQILLGYTVGILTQLAAYFYLNV
jgi:membrane-associated phospholipid phosphatase